MSEIPPLDMDTGVQDDCFYLIVGMEGSVRGIKGKPEQFSNSFHLWRGLTNKTHSPHAPTLPTLSQAHHEPYAHYQYP